MQGICEKRTFRNMSLVLSAAGLSAKRSANQVLLKIKQLLNRYIKRQAKRNTPIDTKEIMETAKEIYCGVAKKLNVETPPMFLTSKGWLDRFMAKHNVKVVKIPVETASGDRQAV